MEGKENNSKGRQTRMRTSGNEKKNMYTVYLNSSVMTNHVK